MQTYLTLTATATATATGDHTDGEIAIYNMTEHDIRAAHITTSFPSPLRPEDVVGMGYIPITPTSMPTYSTWTHRAVLDMPVHDASANDGAGAWVQAWRVEALPEADVAQSLTQRKLHLVQRIDSDVDMLIQRVMGNRASEYELAEKEALQFKAAGYAGDVPASVQSDADANGQTPRWSTERILATASAWRTAQATLRARRLMAKAQAKQAASHDAVDVVEAAWAAGFAEISAGL